MSKKDVRQALIATLDGDLSRSERQALREDVAQAHLPTASLGALRRELFAEVAGRMTDPTDRALLARLDDLVTLLDREPTPPGQAWFGPEDPMVETLDRLVRETRRTIDLAVFTLTDDRLADALKDAHRRGVAIRLLSDDNKSWDSGSDVRRLADAGIPMAMDSSPHHFHHKFCVLDGHRLICGSYNWTRGADRHNRENFLLTSDPALVSRYARAFDALWANLSG